MKLKLTLALVMSACALAIFACAPDISQTPPTPGVLSEFDSDIDNGIPLPNDMLIDPKTGLLDIPAAEGDTQLTKQIKESLNTLDGWLTSQTIAIPWQGEIDTVTLTDTTVFLIDLGVAPPAIVHPSKYIVLNNKGLSPATTAPFILQLKNMPVGGKIQQGSPPAEFPQGGKYMAIVTTGVKNKITDTLKEQYAVIENPAYYFLSDKYPLYFHNRSTTILPEEDAKKLEPARQLYHSVWTILEDAKLADRSKASAFTMFSIQSGSRAVFDPVAIPLVKDAVLPMPNNFKGPANAPLDVQPYIFFDLPLKEDTIGGGVKMFKFIPGGAQPVAITTEFSDVKDLKTGFYKLTIKPSALLDKGSQYMVMTTTAIRTIPSKMPGAPGVPTAAYSYFSLIRNTVDLVTPTPEDPKFACKLNSPLIDSTLDVLMLLGFDPKTAKNDYWVVAFNKLCETLTGINVIRAAYNTAPYPGGPTLMQLGTALGGVKTLEITALWTFTTTSN